MARRLILMHTARAMRLRKPSLSSAAREWVMQAVKFLGQEALAAGCQHWQAIAPSQLQILRASAHASAHVQILDHSKGDEVSTCWLHIYFCYRDMLASLQCMSQPVLKDAGGLRLLMTMIAVLEDDHAGSQLNRQQNTCNAYTQA